MSEETVVEETKEAVSPSLGSLFSGDSGETQGEVKPSEETSSATDGKADEVKAQDTNDAKENAEAKSEATETEAKAEEVKEKSEEKVPEVNYAEENEKLKKEIEVSNKRQRDTANWATGFNSQMSDLKKQNEILSKKMDGTYDAEAEAKANEVDPNLLVQNAKTLGKVEASYSLAKQKYGEETVQKALYNSDSPFRKFDNNPAIQARVLGSDAPVMEAMTVLEEGAFHEKWGSDISAVEAKIKDSFRAELEKKADEKANTQLKERLSKKDGDVVGLKDATGSSSQEDSKGTAKSLSSLFG